MTKAFIVNLNTGSDTDYVTMSEEIQDELTKSGFAVISVKPWSSPTPTVLGAPPQQTIQTPPAPPVPPTIL